MKRILLHTCCGPCFLGTFEGIKSQGFKIHNYFYNPNIQPKKEYEKRLVNLRKSTVGKSEGILTEDYNSNEHKIAVSGKEYEFPERCLGCYSLRLSRTAKKAKEMNFDLFSTTLLISPYQEHDALKRIGQKVATEFDIEFYYQDLRSYFRAGQNLAAENGIYRQKYCGCAFSKDEH